MGLVYRYFLRPLLAFQDSEQAHSRTIKMLRIFGNNFVTRIFLSGLYRSRKSLPISVFGHEYQHPFGLAAGMDKKGEAINGWNSLGLSFAEIGGVTMLEQPGNPKPRMFRSNTHQALVNRMGFNNPGSERMQASLKHHFTRFGKPDIPIWVNLGKSKLTDNKEAHKDYSTTLVRLWDFTDVFVINVSSPNTPDLRDLQSTNELRKIIEECNKANVRKANEAATYPKPLLVKVAPDMSFEQLEDIVTEHIYKFTNGKFPIVGVGGIMNADDAWEKITAGASLIQAYSGFVFEGPSLTSAVVRGLDKKLKQHGLSKIEDAVGLMHKGSN